MVAAPHVTGAMSPLGGRPELVEHVVDDVVGGHRCTGASVVDVRRRAWRGSGCEVVDATGAAARFEVAVDHGTGARVPVCCEPGVVVLIGIATGAVWITVAALRNG